MVNTYLFLAYSFVWLIFMLYAWNLSRRHERLRRELEDLKARVENRPKYKPHDERRFSPWGFSPSTTTVRRRRGP